MKTKKQLTHWLSVIVIGIALGLALQFVRAWTEPTQAPPNGNVGAPINTGSQEQTKQGNLNVGGRLNVGKKLSVGTDTDGDAGGQIKYDGTDFWGYIPGAGWKSLTALGGGGGTTLAPCTISGPHTEWAEGYLLDATSIPFLGIYPIQFVFFWSGASSGTYTNGSVIHVDDINMYTTNGYHMYYTGTYNIQCKDGKWTIW